MKCFLLTSAALFCSLFAFCQTTYRYHFDYGLNEIYSGGPALSAVSDTNCSGIFVSQTLPISVTKNVYQFDKGCGLEFHDAAGFLAGGSYTIELYVKLDTINGYKKLIDFDSLHKDKGLYNRNGKVALYSVFESTDSVFGSGTYNYIAITRDAGTKGMYINCNGMSLGTHADNSDQYVYDTSKRIIFFQDDNGTGGEEASGSVAMIHITDQAMDSNTIKTRYTQLATTLNVGNILQVASFEPYPNPAQDYVHINMPEKCNYSIIGISGKKMLNSSLKRGANDINIENFKAGIYFLQVEFASGESKVFKLMKQ